MDYVPDDDLQTYTYTYTKKKTVLGKISDLLKIPGTSPIYITRRVEKLCNRHSKNFIETLITRAPRCNISAFTLGIYYKSQGNIGDAIKYHLIAANNGIQISYLYLSSLYNITGDKEKRENIIKQGIDRGIKAMIPLLGLFYKWQKRYDDAICVFLSGIIYKSIKMECIRNLFGLYKLTGQYNMMLQFVQDCIECKNTKYIKSLIKHIASHVSNETLHDIVQACYLKNPKDFCIDMYYYNDNIRKYGIAYKFLKEGIHLGSTECMYKYGIELYEYDDIDKKNKGKELLLRSSKLGYRQAVYYLLRNTETIEEVDELLNICKEQKIKLMSSLISDAYKQCGAYDKAEQIILNDKIPSRFMELDLKKIYVKNPSHFVKDFITRTLELRKLKILYNEQYYSPFPGRGYDMAPDVDKEQYWAFW